MHDPFAPITRPLLPGQRFPGLGLGRVRFVFCPDEPLLTSAARYLQQVATVMEGMAEHSKVTDALLNFPFHYHNAVSCRSLTTIVAISAHLPHNTDAVLGYRHLDPICRSVFQYQLSSATDHLSQTPPVCSSMRSKPTSTTDHPRPDFDWFSAQLRPPIDEHGFCFVAWCVSMGHVRRITEQLEADGRWTKVSSRLERWSASEQIYPTGPGLQAFLDCSEWERLNTKYEEIFSRDGGANMQGVSVVATKDGKVRRSTLVIDLEGCPELWQYSKIWHKRDPETGAFH